MDFLQFVWTYLAIAAFIGLVVFIAAVLLNSFHKKIARINEAAIILYRQGKIAEATEELRKAIKINPVNASSHAILAEILSNDQETLNNALEEINTAIKIAPLSGEFYKIRGSILINRLKQIESGKQDLDRAEELHYSSETLLTI